MDNGTRGRRDPPPSWRILLLAMACVGLVLGGVAWAQSSQSELDAKAARYASFAADLDANIQVQDRVLNDTSVRFAVTGTVRNTGTQDWELHLISNKMDGSGWRYERLLGVLQAGTSYTLEQYFEAQYSGQAHARTQYAIVAVGDEVYHGRYFELDEDWTPYLNRTRQELSDMALVFIPIVGGLVLLIVIVLAEWAYSSHAGGAAGSDSEYTVRTFFLPRVGMDAIWQSIANLGAHPLFWLLELALFATMANTIWTELAARTLDGSAQTVWVFSLAAAALMPAIYFALLWAYNEMVERMPLRFMAGMFFWGISAACLALVINTFESQMLGAWIGADSIVLAVLTVALIAPFVEEFLKGIGLLVIRGHHEFSDSLHGLHLGFAVGVGFSFVENWFYLASRTDPVQSGLSAWFGLVIYRSVFNVLAHGSFSAMLGACLGWAKEQKWGRVSVLAFLPGLLIAVILHALFNLTAIGDSFWALSADYPVFGFNPLMTLTLVAMLALLAIGATRDYQKRKRRRAALE